MVTHYDCIQTLSLNLETVEKLKLVVIYFVYLIV